KDDNTNDYPDGCYKFSVSAASNTSGINVEKYVTLYIDSTPPHITINNPLDGSYIKDILDITGDIIDDNLSVFYTEYGLGNTPPGYILISEDNKSGTNLKLVKMDTKILLNDIYTFRVTAIDRAGNQTVTTRSLNVDNKKPLALITSPKNDSFVGNENLQIIGTAWDENITTYLLEYKLNTNDIWDKINEGTVNIEDTILGELDKAIITENLSIRLTVSDKAGNTSTDEISLNADNIAPFIQINEPTADSYVGQTVSIIGTIYDDNLKDYKVYLGKGTNPDNFDLIYTGFANIDNDVIHIFDAFDLAGEYTIKIEATDQSDRITSEQVIFIIDTQSPTVNILTPTSGYYSTSVTISAEIHDDNEITSYVLLYGEGEAPIVFAELFSSTGSVARVDIYTWDISALNGNYTLLLKALDTCGNESFDKVNLNFDNIPPELTGVSILPQIFHPLSPVNTANLALSISENSFLTFEIIDSQNNIVCTILSNSFYEHGDYSFSLSGKLNEYTILPDDNYTLKINAVDKAGNTAIAQLSFEILKDIQAPTAEISDASNYYFSPNGDGVKDNTVINVLISDNKDRDIISSFYFIDSNNSIVKLFPETISIQGAHDVTWDGTDNFGNIVVNGIYTLKCNLTDILGNNNEITLGTFVVDTINPVISDLNISEPLISPNYDGIKDYTLIDFNINEDTTIDFDIYFTQEGESEPAKVHTLSLDRIYTPGKYKFIWMGEGYVADGDYDYIIKYTDLAGNSGINKTGIIEIDLTLPILSLDELPEYLKDVVELKGSMDEANLKEYSVYYREVSTNEWVLLNQSTDMPTDNIIGIWNTNTLPHKEGFYIVRLDVSDHAGLSSSVEKFVRVDNQMPIADFIIIEVPYHNDESDEDYYNGVLTIEGSINDTFLDNYKLLYIDNITEETTDIPLLTDGNTSINNKTFARWNTEGLDGNYTLQLVVKDKSGNTTIVEKSYNIDSVQPEITDFTLEPTLISPENQDGSNDIAVSTFNINEDSTVKSKIISSNILYNWQAKGYGTKIEYPNQDVSFNVTADGYQTEYPEQTFDYIVDFVADEEFEELRLGGFSIPSAGDNIISVDSRNGCVWVVDGIYGDFRLVKLDSAGNELLRKNEFIYISGISVDSTDGSVWIIASREIVKLDSLGNELLRRGGFGGNSNEICVNPTDGSVWIIASREIIKLDSLGNELLRKSGFHYICDVSVNSTDGSVWVADGRNDIVKLDSLGNELLRENGFYDIERISVNSTDGSVWIADFGYKLGGKVVKLDSSGNRLVYISGFFWPRGVSVNSADGSIWVVGYYDGALAKFDSSGNELLRKSGFSYSSCDVSVNPTDSSVWIADGDYNEVIKLSKTKSENYLNLDANAGPNGEHKNLFPYFKNYISSQNVSGHFKVNSTTSTPVPAYNPGPNEPHPYVKVYIDNKGTSDFMDDEVIAYVEESIPDTVNPNVPWSSLSTINEQVNAKNTITLDIPGDLLINGLEQDPNGNSSTFTIDNISNPNVTVEIKTYTSGPKEGRHYIEITAKPETIITDENWQTPQLQGANYMVSKNNDNIHNIYTDSGYVLPITDTVDLTVDKWEVKLVRYNGEENFDDAYIIELDSNGFIYNDSFTVRATGDAAEIKVFDEYFANSINIVDSPIDDWDGTGQSGDIYVPDGDYLYYSEIFDKAGNRDYVMESIGVDNTPPVVNIVNFVSTIFEPVSIKGDAYDTNRFKYYEISIYDEQDNLIENSIKYNPVINDELFYWDPTGLVTGIPKNFRIVLDAYDEAENHSQIEENITIGEIDSIVKLYSSKQYISPQNIDSSKTKANIDFKLLSEADLIIDVYDNIDVTGDTTKNITNETSLSPQDYKGIYYWDGKDNNDGYVIAGNYFIKIQATDPLNPDTKTNRVVEVVVDNKIDNARIDNPADNLFVNSELIDVHVSIDEPNLLYYSLFYKINSESDDKYREIFKSNNNQDFPLNSKKIFEFIVPPEEDRYNLKLKVEDLAGNILEDVVSIEKDNTAPVVKLEIDKAYDTADEKIVSGIINISGTIFDKNIKNYSLSIQ
ncbi:MAG: Ig-like domain repeat protein, partial [Spirochaetes bacterium]|nr:Ig-like domain repeat protein [Spirochaetota bacterium]